MSQHITNTLDVLLVQEKVYMASDYLRRLTSDAVEDVVVVDAYCRVKMAEWCDQCVDFCKFDREVVEITLNYLDRFASTSSGRSILMDRGEFQLATMTALYTAIKIHQPEAVSSKSISALSRGRYTKEDIESMEVRMITALSWKMNPVTVSAFVRAILEEIPKADDTNTIDHKSLYHLAKLQTDAAVRDYAFCTILPSVIAYSAVLNAVESMGQSIPHIEKRSFLHRLTLTPHHDLVVIQKYLYASIADTTIPNTTSIVNSPTRRRPSTPAPDNEQSNFKLRRIASMDSPRSSLAVEC